MWLHSTPEKYDFDEFESILSKAAVFTKVPPFPMIFVEKRFFLIYSYVMDNDKFYSVCSFMKIYKITVTIKMAKVSCKLLTVSRIF